MQGDNGASPVRDITHEAHLFNLFVIIEILAYITRI